MEQCNNCTSCQSLRALVQKLHSKFAIYKKKNIQNDEFLNTFKKQNMLLAALKNELQSKNASLEETRNQLKCAQVECSALRHTLEKEKEDNEKKMMAKFKDTEQELRTLRNELEATKTELQAQYVNNAQLIEKLEEDTTSKTGLEKSFAEEKKGLLEKIANADNEIAAFNRRMTLWSNLKNDREKLARSVLRFIKDRERSNEAAKLEANLLNCSDSDVLDLEDGGVTSPIDSPKKSKTKDKFHTIDTSDDDFEEVATEKSPVQPVPGDSLTDYNSCLTEEDDPLKEHLGIADINLTAVSPSKANKKKTSPRSATVRNASPRKISPRQASTVKILETIREVKSAHVQTASDVRHIGCDPLESERTSPRSASLRNASSGKASSVKILETIREVKSAHVQTAPDVRHIGCDPLESERTSPRSASLRNASSGKASPVKILETIREVKSAHVQTASDVRHIGCDPLESERTSPRSASLRNASSGKASPVKILETIREVKSAHVRTAPDVRHIGCDPVESENDKKVRTEDHCLASIREDFDAPLSPFRDTCFSGSETTSNSTGVVTSQRALSTLCEICDSLLSKCTNVLCRSVFEELSEYKMSKESPSELPLRETSTDQVQKGSLFSSPRLQKQNSSDLSVLELPCEEKNPSLDFRDTNSQLVKVDACIQTISISPQRKHAKTQTTKNGSWRTIGCQSELIHISEGRLTKASRHILSTESTATQTDLPPLTSEESVKCTLCDNKTESAVCPMKEFLRTSLTSLIQQSKFVSNLAMKDFLETSLASLIKQSDFISCCSGVFSGYSSLGPGNLPPFYVQHSGMFAPNTAVPLYGTFNPSWCFPPDDTTCRSRQLHMPTFKKEDRFLSNYDVSDGEESGRRRRRSRSRSGISKLSVSKEGSETYLQRASDSPIRLQSESKQTDSSDSSVEEIEVREGGTKRRLKNCSCCSKEVTNPRKKSKHLNQHAVRSGNRLSSESSCHVSESRVDKKNSRITQLNSSSSGEKQQQPNRSRLPPDSTEEDCELSSNDPPLEDARSQEDSRSFSGELPRVKEKSNFRIEKHTLNQNKPPAFSTNEPLLLLPALTEKSIDSLSQQTGNQEESQFADLAKHRPLLSPSVPEKNKDSSLHVTPDRDEPHFVVPTHRPPRANIKKNKNFEKNLQTVKSAISFVSGGVFASSYDIKSSSKLGNIEPVCANACSVDTEVDCAASLRMKNAPVSSDQFTRESERQETGSSVAFDSEYKTVVPKSTATSGEDKLFSRNYKSHSFVRKATLAKLDYKGEDVEKPRKEFLQLGTPENPSFSQDSRVIQRDQEIRSPIKSACLDLRKTSAVLEEDLCLSEDSDSDVEIKRDDVENFSSDNVREVIPDGVKKVSPNGVKEASLDGVKEVSSDDVKDVSSDDVKDVSPDNVEDVSPDNVKNVSPDNVKNVSPDNVKYVGPDNVNGFSPDYSEGKSKEEADKKFKTVNREEAVPEFKVQDCVMQKTNQEVDSHASGLAAQSEAEENGYDVGEEEVDVRASGKAEKLGTQKEIEGVLGALLFEKDFEESEAVPVEACDKQKACFDGKCYEDSLASSTANIQNGNFTAAGDSSQVGVELAEEKEMALVEVCENGSIFVQNDSELRNVIQESVSHSEVLHQLDAAVTTALVEVFPDIEVSAEDLVLESINQDITTGSSIIDVSDSDSRKEEVDVGASSQLVASGGLGQRVQDRVATATLESGSDSVVNSGKLFDDLENSENQNSCVEEDMLKDEETKGKDESDTEISGSVFGSLFEDLAQSDSNSSGVGDLIAAVLPDLSDDFSEADSPKMVIDAEEPTTQEDEIVIPGDVPSENERSDLTDSPNVSTTTSTERNDGGIGIPDDLLEKRALTFVTNNQNENDTFNKEISPKKPVPTAPKPDVPMVVPPTGPYFTRKGSRGLSNQKIASSSPIKHKAEESGETVSENIDSSARRLRSRTGLESHVPNKKKKITSREFISTDSGSDSDSEKLVIFEEGNDSSGGLSPELKRSEDSCSRIGNCELSLESTAIGVKTRMRTRSTGQDDSLSVKKRKYSTRFTSGSGSSKSDVSDESPSERITTETKKLLESNEPTNNSPPHNLRPRARESRINVIPEPKRRSLRNCNKTKSPSSETSFSDGESSLPSDAEREVSLMTVSANPKRSSKLEKLRKNLSKRHPLLQQAGHRLEPTPLKRVKADTPDEIRSEEGRTKLGASLQMAKSGRTVCILSEGPKNLRQRQKPKDTSKTAVPGGTPASVITKPRITPQERLAALHLSANIVQTITKEVASPGRTQRIEIPKLIPAEPVSTSTTQRIDPSGQADVLGPAPARAPILNPMSEITRRGYTPPKEQQQRTASICEVNGTTDAPIFKRSNSIRIVRANRPIIPGPADNSSTLRLESATPSVTSPNGVVFNKSNFCSPVSAAAQIPPLEGSCGKMRLGLPEATSKNVLSSTVPAAVFSTPAQEGNLADSLQDSSISNSTRVSPIRPKRSDIWVQPAMEIETSQNAPRRAMRTLNERTLLAAPLVNNEQTVISGRDLIAMIDSTPLVNTLSTELVSEDRHPFLHAWKRRGINVTFMRDQDGVLASGMAESVPAIKKLLNTYWSSPYFTEELLTRTVHSLLNPKYMCVDAIVSRLMVGMVEVDFDSQPCIDSPGPGQFLTKIQQQIIALLMRLFPIYRSIVRDVLLLIEHHIYSFGHSNEVGRLPWLTVLHTSLCRVMKWREVSLIFCYDAMYCYVSRFATILLSVFQVWPELLPKFIDKRTMGSMFQVMAHFVMTQGEPDKESDLKALRAIFVMKKLYSGDTNSSELTQKVTQDMKEGKCEPISPALILISKREDIAWAQDKVANQHLLPMVRDWLLKNNDPTCPPLPPAAVLTLCAIVRAFRGSESAVSTTHTLMRTLLLDTKAVAAFPALERAVCAGLIFLSRHNIEFVVDAVKKWQPRNQVPEWLIEILLNLINCRARPPVWWAKEMRNLLQSVEPFPLFTKVDV